MKRLLLFIALLISSVTAFANDTPADKVELQGHRIVVNGVRLNITRQYDGKRLDLYNETIFEVSGKNPGLFLSFYPDKVPSSEWQPTTEHIIITDATGNKVRQSNRLDTGIEFDWGDNNYVIFEDGAMYFGIYNRRCNENNCRSMYVPYRMQFVYRDGKLEENKGPWRGPAKPEIYIEPTGKDPCFNVNGVEACREELVRERATKQAKQKRKAAASATTK
ncbi:hypothetical protein AT959_14735 [Dechloromonas denitrificans]|uniref:Lipoprotein n=1 Tax=Dechloromonas denitrificans TaxID=281362 RepID=A0A133XHZ8_9RHOO|nr:hypothetical protein [Dechloromonas denitrificans]KXB30577.1 hypothetical protein AT959_14735 [Dechloromonas denitrificans]